MYTIKQMWSRLQERIAEKNKVQKTIKELNQLTDYELQDLGIMRYDIPRIAGGCRNEKTA